MIVVVGGTGQVGGQVVQQLRDRGEPVRVVSRGLRPGRLPAGVDAVRADLANPASLAQALDGAKAMFLVWPFTDVALTASLAPQVAEIAARHVPRIVYLSAQPAADRPGSFWALVEHAIEQSGAEWTFLRPTGFASNTLMWADQIRAGDVVRWPYAKAARALIDERDIAAVAAAALTKDGHAGQRYMLSGPEVLTQEQQLSGIGQALGRDLMWEELSTAEAREALMSAWGDAAFVDSALTAWENFVEHPEHVTSVVPEITGEPAHRFADWAQLHAAAFR
ncbi:MAG TPA: NmrA family NAD(P)-binding protein [Streptosporangiaceae bacterium]|jgi:uncharacterized protein YbjT (DUF2867 family)|nr:NmrA family NAD(P)-binding protein [Streptosporangiaceae bacterium]